VVLIKDSLENIGRYDRFILFYRKVQKRRRILPIFLMLDYIATLLATGEGKMRLGGAWPAMFLTGHHAMLQAGCHATPLTLFQLNRVNDLSGVLCEEQQTAGDSLQSS
jgi:hypothetical protein